MRPRARSAAKLASLIASRRVEMRGRRGESGQALMMALIVVMMFALLPTISFITLRAVQPAVSSAVKYDAALAAAQAGLQEYRTLLDQYSDYSEYSGSNEPPASEGGCNAAFTGGPSSCPTSWVSVSSSSTTLPESFEYTPNTSQLDNSSATGTFAGQLLLTVIGRAGTGSGSVYRRIEASLELSGAVQDVYFSTFEQPGPQDYDQWDNVYHNGGLVPSGSTYQWDEATETVQPVTASNNSSDPNTGETYAQALCEYDAWQPNTYVDWYSQNVSPVYPPTGNYPNQGEAYNTTTNMYYGPWYGTWTDPESTSAYQLQFGNSAGSNGSCLTNYYITGNSFNGPVYSQDELTTCQQPSFTSLTTEVSQSFDFPKGWPGAKVNGSVSNPYGYNDDPFGICGTPGTPSDEPTIASGEVNFGETQSLPPLANEIGTEIEDDQLLGCVYTGPTAIRFYYNPLAQSEMMDVWSPLTKDAYASTYGGETAQCGSVATNGAQDLCGGSGSTCSPQVTGCPSSGCTSSSPGTVQTASADFAQVPVLPGEVIWVQDTPISSPTDPNYWATLPKAESGPYSGCIDPWVQPSAVGETTDSNVCSEGDLMVGGVTHGGITLGSADNIILARSLAYSCALSSTSIDDPSFTSSISNCSSSSDITGLIADSDVWMADPVGASYDVPSAATTQCSDDYDVPLSSISWDDMIPNECYVSNPVIDAAVGALNGFFEIDNWEFASSHGTLTLNGSQEVLNAGQYGVFSSPTSVIDGYVVRLNYDTRLMYAPPPGYLQAIGAIWEITAWISCGSSPGPDYSPASCSSLSS